jgi:hypothetical protein
LLFAALVVPTVVSALDWEEGGPERGLDHRPRARRPGSCLGLRFDARRLFVTSSANGTLHAGAAFDPVNLFASIDGDDTWTPRDTGIGADVSAAYADYVRLSMEHAVETESLVLLR